LSKLPKEIVDQLSMFGLIEARNGFYGFRDCKSRSNNPSLKRPICSAAPESNCGI
jgi:hypothetical protein